MEGVFFSVILAELLMLWLFSSFPSYLCFFRYRLLIYKWISSSGSTVFDSSSLKVLYETMVRSVW